MLEAQIPFFLALPLHVPPFGTLSAPSHCFYAELPHTLGSFE